MKSKYVDSAAIIQVIGNIFNDPSLLELTDKFKITADDFPEDFHKIVFGSIYNISKNNSAVSLNSVLDYLAGRPKYEAIFKQNNGVQYIQEVSKVADFDTFGYYYARLKKMTLLRGYESVGCEKLIQELYDPNNFLDSKKKQEQEDWLDNSTLEDIATEIDNKIESVKMSYVSEVKGRSYQAAEGIIDLIEDLEENPEMGLPLYGRLINTVTRGARLKKLYLRSAGTGVGKTRALVADACYLACDTIYDEKFGWVSNGIKAPTLFIATEQDLGEIQTLMLAFLSNVNEEHILNGQYLEGERARVIKAAGILKESPIWVETIPDFSLQDIEDKIKYHIREHDVSYIFYDYLHSSLKILSEITKQTSGMKLREDNILFMLSARLKDICNQYGVFIETATQLSGDFKNAETPDQSLLRGAKSIADKIDYGALLMNVTNDDLIGLEPLTSTGKFKIPDLKISVYKNRRGRYKGVYLWCQADLGTCRINPMYVTKYNYEMESIEDIRITIENEKAPWQKA